MTAFAPPEFVFNGINFNPNFYDNPPLTPSSSGSIPNPLPVAQLNTNSIQALNNAVPVNLYTTFTNILNLGNSLVTDIIVESGSALSILATTILTIGSSALANLYINAYSINFYSVESYFNNVANTCKISLFSNDLTPSIQFNSSTSGGFNDASIEVNPKATTPTTDYEGTVNVRATTLKTPQTITSLTPSSQVNLFTDQTADISLGTSAISLKSPTTITSLAPASVMNLFTNQTNSISLGNSGITLRSPNTVVGQLASAPQNLFTTTTGAINLGGAMTLRLSTPNDIISSSIASVLNLFATQTGQINIGASSSTLSTPLTMITSSIASVLNLFATQTGQINLGASTATLATPLTMITSSITSVLNLFATQTGQINLGASSSTLVLPNTIRSALATAQTLFTNQTANITLGGTSVPTLALTGTALSLNSTNSTTNTVALGSQTSSTNTLVGTNLYLNNTNGLSNNVNVGGSNTATSDIKGANINVNSTYLTTNNVNIGSSFSTNTILGITNINTTGTLNTTIGGSGGNVSITSAAGITLNGGIKLGGSNFTGNIKIAFGVQTTTPGTGSPGLSATQTITFGATFGANPFVFLQIIKNTYTGGAGQMCIGLESVSTTNCSFSVRNNSNTGAAANTYYVNWLAIGQY